MTDDKPKCIENRQDCDLCNNYYTKSKEEPSNKVINITEPKPLENKYSIFWRGRIWRTDNEIRSALEFAEKNTIEKETCNKPRCVQCDVAKAVIEIYRQAFQAVLKGGER